jgi:hypothetical protein
MVGTKTTIAIAFALFVGVTLIIPGFPPAQLLFKLMGLPQSTLVILGVSVASVFGGIINGVFWTIFAATAYSLVRIVPSSRNPKPLAPLPVARSLARPLLDNPHVDSWLKEIPLAPVPGAKPSRRMRGRPGRAVKRPKPLSIRFSKVPVGAELDIEVVEGIGSAFGGVLKILGIDTVSDLLRVGATERGRHRLAKEIGVTPATVLRWVYRGDLLVRRGAERNCSTVLYSRNDVYERAR